MNCIKLRKYFIPALLAIFFVQNIYADNFTLKSPNEKIIVKIRVDKGTAYELWYETTQLITLSAIAMNLQDGEVIGNGTVNAIVTDYVNDAIDVAFGKNNTLKEEYNELIIHYNEGYDLIFRAYNEGMAYRFKTSLNRDMIIKNEDMIFNFAGDPAVYFPQSPDLRNFEKTYEIYNTVNDISSDVFSVTPVMFDYKKSGHKLVITEADTYDYPGLYMKRNGNNSMRGMWASYPETVEKPDNYYDVHLPITRYDYIANTTGNRVFPWRVFIATDNEVSLLNNELVYLLAEPQRFEDTSWIQPGKTTWEWWHKSMLEDVDFPVGYDNLGYDLYKYYIDFASANKIEYLTLDAGWKESYIKRLCSYAAEKKVKIIVWSWASCFLENEGWIERMKSYGIAGVKIDFFERNDQIAMTWGHKMAEKLAELKMIALYHGCPVPTGLNRTFPNILNFEAVRGAECNFWDRGSTPEYHVQFPFIRQLAGPLDYTPGSMRNKTEKEFFPVDKPNVVPSSMGTRAHELAMYVVFDHWLAYLCDAPTEYEKYPDILDFFSTVPAVWDKTLPLDGKVGEYILMAKQTGNDWYVGGMTNRVSRNCDVKFNFLKPGKIYEATIYKDSADSDNYPTKYVCERMTLTGESEMTLRMAEGGGFVIRLKEL